jgi:pimeloyl-ACP methyl ester carboxylesterase
MEKIISAVVGGYLNTLTLLAPGKAGHQGVNIFCYPFRPPLKSYHREFLKASQKFDFNFQGLRLQAYRWGTGSRKILFLHGWQSHSFRWKNYIQSLSPEEFTIYAFDAPGHGFSEGRFLSVPFYSEAIQQFVLQTGEIDTAVAHSVGSFSLIYTLYRIPLMPVKSLVLMAPPGEALDFIDVFSQRLNLSERAIQVTLTHFERRFGKPVSYFSTSEFAKSLKVPGIIIHDEDDADTPHRYAQKINRAWSRSLLITTKGLGHNLKSPEVVKVVSDYANGTFNAESIQQKNEFTVKVT